MSSNNDLKSQILSIMNDPTLSEKEKSKKRQSLMCNKVWNSNNEDNDKKNETAIDMIKCIICQDICNRPVTAPCQHNFCLVCFKRWSQNKGNKTCPTCRKVFTEAFISNPRINTVLVSAIKIFTERKDNTTNYNINDVNQSKMSYLSRPDTAFSTERAKRSGKANAASGRIMVTTSNEHFGPILAEHDPSRNRGVLVGDWWHDRLECRQWGAHFPHVAGIAGQSDAGAQSVVLSGGYEDDRDEGEWFLYTGSGGRDLSGNKRTNKYQSFDQEFKSYNEALRKSCIRGLPVRVVRSYKEKRSAYAPSQHTPVRYDGIYRILRCWRKKGKQNYLMCRYLFVRCDNAAAPWSTDSVGDGVMGIPREAEAEINGAEGEVYKMTDMPFWDYIKAKGKWEWTRTPSVSSTKYKRKNNEIVASKINFKTKIQNPVLKDFSCGICKLILKEPITSTCGHCFCKKCLNKKYEEVKKLNKRNIDNNKTRSLRPRKLKFNCPVCDMDLTSFIDSAQVNREMAELVLKVTELYPGKKNETLDVDSEEELNENKNEEMEIDTIITPTINNSVKKEEEEEKIELIIKSIQNQYPEFELELIKGLMFDQGNDEKEVLHYLQRMKKEMKRKRIDEEVKVDVKKKKTEKEDK